MNTTVRYNCPLTPFGERLARCAREASRAAIARTHAAGLSVTVMKGNKIIEIAPDGTETVIKEVSP